MLLQITKAEKINKKLQVWIPIISIDIKELIEWFCWIKQNTFYRNNESLKAAVVVTLQQQKAALKCQWHLPPQLSPNNKARAMSSSELAQSLSAQARHSSKYSH